MSAAEKTCIDKQAMVYVLLYAKIGIEFMRTLLLATVALVLSSCGCYRPPPSGQIPGGPNIPALEYVVVTYSDELLKEKRLYLRNARAFYDVDGIERVEMCFRTQAIMDIDEARDVFVYLVEGFLARVNEDDDVAFDLSNYPFDEYNLKIEIELESDYVRYVDEDYLARIVMEKGIVYYYAHTAINPAYTKYHERIEPYVKTLHFSKFKTYRPWLNATWHDPKKDRNPEESESGSFEIIQ